MKPVISVVTVCFDAARTIADTLTSVAAQTDVEFEHIVVDGGSRDDTMRIVKHRAGARLSAVSEPDDGIYDAMNKGLARATGEYVLFLNADDYLAGPDSLSRAAAALAASRADILFADTQFVADNGASRVRRRYSVRRFAPWWLRVGAMPPHPSMFLRRSLMHELKGYDTSYRIAGDFDLVARAILSRRASFTLLPEVLTHFRVGGVSTAGLRSKLVVNRECARSLRELGQPLASIAVFLRLPLKLAQYRLMSPAAPST